MLAKMLETIQATEADADRRALVEYLGEIVEALRVGDLGAAEKYAHRFDLAAGL